jgi:hypothetical protein
MRAALIAQQIRTEGGSANDKEGRNNPVPPAISKLEASFNAQIKQVEAQTAAVALEVQRKGEQTVGSVDTAKDRISAAQAETKRETTRGAQSVSAATRQGTTTVAGATRGVSPPIVAAIRANRPIINVSVSSTSITKVTTVNARYGKNSGSGGQNQVKPA